MRPFQQVLFAAIACSALLAAPMSARAGKAPAVPVDLGNFIRAETDMYFGATARQGAFGKLEHLRALTSIEQQDVVRMNRDTLYSSGAFDLDAAPVTVTLPDPGGRYMAMQALSEDHYTIEVVDAPGTFTYTREKVGTRYLFLIVRTLPDSGRKPDLKVVHALQDRIRVEQKSSGRFEVPNWDKASQDKVRAELIARGAAGVSGVMFGARSEVDPAAHLIGTATGWGGNPRRAAVYEMVVPPANDGRTLHFLTVRDVPVDGFWSISVYNAKGYFEKNDLGLYSLNNLNAKVNRDGSTTVQFGGCKAGGSNCLPITPGWNYTVRLYRPRQPILDGTWKFPEARPVSAAPQ